MKRSYLINWAKSVPVGVAPGHGHAPGPVAGGKWDPPQITMTGSGKGGTKYGVTLTVQPTKAGRWGAASRAGRACAADPLGSARLASKGISSKQQFAQGYATAGR